MLGILVVGLLIRRITRDEQVNARLETEKKVLSHELEIAHDIQMGILKDENEKKQAQGNGDIELQTLLVPMREVGGDLFDFHREGDELWFIIGDVSGKGVPAAIFMSAAVNLFRAAGVRANSPNEIMEEMNAVPSENNPDKRPSLRVCRWSRIYRWALTVITRSWSKVACSAKEIPLSFIRMV